MNCVLIYLNKRGNAEAQKRMKNLVKFLFIRRQFEKVTEQKRFFEEKE
jgi:hypothetical protein